MLRSGFDADSFDSHIADLDLLIRDYVDADPYYEFAFEDYVQSLDADVDIGPFNSIGLRRFVEDRSDYVRDQLNAASLPSDLRLNEVQSNNQSTLADEAGEYDPWVEISNLGPGAVALETIYISNDLGESGRLAAATGFVFRWRFPSALA